MPHCHLRTQEAEGGGCQVLGQPDQRDPVSKRRYHAAEVCQSVRRRRRRGGEEEGWYSLKLVPGRSSLSSPEVLVRDWMHALKSKVFSMLGLGMLGLYKALSHS